LDSPLFMSAYWHAADRPYSSATSMVCSLPKKLHLDVWTSLSLGNVTERNLQIAKARFAATQASVDEQLMYGLGTELGRRVKVPISITRVE
jgi:hypothetical protein